MKRFRQILEISLGVLSIDIAYYFFYLPSSLVTGGVSGVSIIIGDYLPFSPSIFMYIVNIVLLIIGLVLLGKDFFFKTVYSTVLAPTIILLFENVADSSLFMQNVTQGTYIIACICGSLFTALGLGLCFRNNSATGGMDVIQKIMSKYLHIPYSKTMYFTDLVVILIGGIIFSPFGYNVEKVVYGIIAVFVTGLVVDYIALNGKSRRTAYIITNKPEIVKSIIYSKIVRGVTECDVRGGYSGDDKVMLICTLDKSQSYRLSEYVKEADSEAFTFITTTREVLGNYRR